MLPNNHSLIIVLDGPSAITFYRDRSMQVVLPRRPHTSRISKDEDDEAWLSDEDIAATLSEENIFGHSDAFTAFEQPSDECLSALRPSQIRYIPRHAPTSRELKAIPYDSFGIQPPTGEFPLFLLVADNRQRRRVRFVNQRSCAVGFPRRSFYCMDDTVYVPRPEPTFLSMSHYLTLSGLLLLAMELCGHYRLVGAPANRPFSDSQTIFGQQPITSVSRLSHYIERAEGFLGIKQARRALKYTAEHSASPMESVVYLLLCLPRALGGYGLRRPILNAKRAVHRSAESFTLANHLVPDLYWPDYRLDVEYDSDEFHSDAMSLQAGAHRTLALRAMNVDVMSLTYDIVADPVAFESIARIIAKRLGQRWHTPTEHERAIQNDLRASLLANANVCKQKLAAS